MTTVLTSSNKSCGPCYRPRRSCWRPVHVQVSDLIRHIHCRELTPPNPLFCCCWGHRRGNDRVRSAASNTWTTEATENLSGRRRGLYFVGDSGVVFTCRSPGDQNVQGQMTGDGSIKPMNTWAHMSVTASHWLMRLIHQPPLCKAFRFRVHLEARAR